MFRQEKVFAGKNQHAAPGLCILDFPNITDTQLNLRSVSKLYRAQSIKSQMPTLRRCCTTLPWSE